MGTVPAPARSSLQSLPLSSSSIGAAAMVAALGLGALVWRLGMVAASKGLAPLKTEQGGIRLSEPIAVRSSEITMAGKKKSNGKVGLTPEQRTQYSRERREIVGQTITQSGAFKGARITEHIRGSQYKVELPSGVVLDAAHKKQNTVAGNFDAGWSEWETRF